MKSVAQLARLTECTGAGRTAGVVANENAHSDRVTAEKVVRPGNATRVHPETIDTVRQILTERLELN